MFDIKLVIVFILSLSYVVLVINSQSCSPPTTCISVYNCSAVLELVIANNPVTNNYVKSLACTGGAGVRYPVCCSPTNTVGPSDTRNSVTNLGSGSGNILPKKGQCGTSSIGNRIYGGNATGIDEFPWMALLQYEHPNKPGVKTFSCGGSLINKRYILTAAHCIKGEIETVVGKLVNVRLGEYDLSTDKDCIDVDCSDPVLDVPVEKVIAHAEYDHRSRNKANDIGLVRLSHEVEYSDFVKPVCLPSALKLQRSQASDVLVSSGWGRTLERKQSNLKLKVNLPVTDQMACITRYSSLRTDLADSQLCAGGEYAEDTCDGDSGGPLMKETNSFWAIEGIVSFGRGCGLENWPAVYTRVSSFEPWIKENLEP